MGFKLKASKWQQELAQKILKSGQFFRFNLLIIKESTTLGRKEF